MLLIEKIVVSAIAIALAFFMTKLFNWMIERVVNFHKKYNASNIERQPVKFFISNAKRIAAIAGYVYWGALILILFGIWFKS